MINKFINRLRQHRYLKNTDPWDIANEKNVVVTFTGGLGAQLLSAAIYFYLESIGASVCADLSYFKISEKKADLGEGLSQWGWQLDGYGIKFDYFRCHNVQDKNHRDAFLINDGPLKLSLAISALSRGCVNSRFPILEKSIEDLGLLNMLSKINQVPYLCLHIRRGDYLNVASYLVPDEDFIRLTARFKNIFKRVVIVSDSQLSNNFLSELKNNITEVIALDGSRYSEFLCHVVMRKATVLVCSNSQYSLSAGVLNENLVIIPKKWFSGRSSNLQHVVDNFSKFQIFI